MFLWENTLKRKERDDQIIYICHKQLKQWLLNRGYRKDHVDSEIERVKLVDRTVLLQKRDKKVDDNITLVLIYHPALNQVYEILRRAHKLVLKSPRLRSALPLPAKSSFSKRKNNWRQTRTF